jgi:CHAT domain-containing protein
MQKIILLSILHLFSGFAYGSCCSFDLAYTPEALSIPNETSILSCINQEGCDSLFLFTQRMILAEENGNIAFMTDNFERILSLIEKKDKGDTTSLKIVYLYATFLEKAGESTVSSAYYEYIKLNSQTTSVLHTLAHIGTIGIRGNIKDIKEAKDRVLKSIDQGVFTTNEIVSVLIRLNNFLSIEEGYNFFLEPLISSISLREDLDPKLNYIYLSKVVTFLAREEDENLNKVFSRAELAFNRLPVDKFKTSYLRLNLMVAIANSQYDKALKNSNDLVKLMFGKENSIDDILQNPPRYDLQKYKSLHSHALSNLYQTRVRPGLEPVKKAFDIYELFYKEKLKASLESTSSLIPDKPLHIKTYEINILVVGYYLYQSTGDVSYLNRAISIIDTNIGIGSYYWTTARNFLRSNQSFWEDISTQRTISNSLLSISSKTSLSAILSLQNKLDKQRKEMKFDHSTFFDHLSSNYEINLDQISEHSAETDSGILAFYAENGLLYRLFVTTDTIQITDLYLQRQQITSSTQTLQSTPNPKTKLNENAEASRELYGLLFGDIDSLLPPNLHIIATGELENVPFNALRREVPGEAARYLGVEVALSRQMSIGSMRLMEEMEMEPRYQRPLGMAPVFKNEALAISDLRQAGFMLPPLLYSTDEVEYLDERGPGNFFYGEEANRDNYLANVSDHSIIHLATHAISSQTDGLESRIYLASEGEETSELYLSDIGDQTLNADLVVLSACETGSGSQHTTEGRISLTKAYLAAGARSVVSSNWAVDDFATAALMKFFYQHIQDGKPPHQALQLSRKAYLEKYPDAPPYKWAAFDAYGGMKPVRWDRSRSKWPLVGYGALGLVVVGLGAAYLRRRRRVV